MCATGHLIENAGDEFITRTEDFSTWYQYQC